MEELGYAESAMAPDNDLSVIHLPENIVLQILGYLSVKDRCIAGRVCKQWRRIVKDNSLWRHVNLLEYRLDLPKMWKVFRAHFSPCLLTFRIKGFAHSDSIKRKKPSLSDAMLKELSIRCPNLTLLELHDCNTDNLTFESLPTTLTSLLITYSTWQPRWLKGHHGHLTKLESLDLSKSVRVDNLDIEDIAKLTNLKELSLSGCYRIDGSNFELIAKNLVRLDKLNISYTGVDELAIHHISRHMKCLQELYISHCPNINDSSLTLVATGLSKLRIIDVTHCEEVTITGLETLSTRRQLKIITCVNDVTLSDFRQKLSK
ncbi:F-box/LRR-repeat protein 12-like isoform X1 [Biomphalaria glabrata]|uniref:F-box/LRR-repeat protein 12-like isoform X1 n=2 Tax=Biomphalaria glabrata TaxID=6526 RepID=A0A9U8E403_BIOGL|nr:F-box/LRR-repeat protein 12-like isoform X1 [Biomphalaria glabrata]KAI8786538.1 F-box/LRR-repeat protein 12 isoform X2 [Biomphalaria glabrata]